MKIIKRKCRCCGVDMTDCHPARKYCIDCKGKKIDTKIRKCRYCGFDITEYHPAIKICKDINCRKRYKAERNEKRKIYMRNIMKMARENENKS